MSRIFRHILFIIMLLAASQAAGQYIIDRVCVGSTRYYRIDGEPGSTYTWRLTDSFSNVTSLTSTADTVQIIWNVTPGDYKLSAIQHSILTNCDGVIEIGDIHVFNGPLAFAGNSKTICNMAPVLLNEATALNYSHLSWTTTGDGIFTNDTILNPLYTPGPLDISAGTVTLILTASGQGVSGACAPAIDSLIINTAPPVLANAGPDDETCQGVNFVVINATASNYGSIKWTHNGTGNLLNWNTTSPVYVPGASETGIIILTMKAFDILPCTDSTEDQMQLTIHPVPTASLLVSGRDTLCGGDTTTLRINLAGTPPWSFTLTDGTNSIPYTGIMTSPVFANIAPSVTSTYSIINLSDFYCSGPPSSPAGMINIIVHPRPGAEFSWNFGPQNNVIEFHADSTVMNFPAIGNMMEWNFGDGTYGYEANPVHTYPTWGNYTVTLTATDTNGCTSFVTHIIIIPVEPIVFFASTSPACSGNPVCFTDLSTVPQPPFGWIVKWVWSYGDGTPDLVVNFPDMPNNCHTYAQIGSYPATLTVTTNTGYTGSYTRIQDVIPSPVANFTVSEACQSQIVQFTDISDPNNGGTIASWNWDFGDPLSGTQNTSTLQNPQHIFSTGGTTYNVRLVINNYNTCKDTLIKPVYVRPAPQVDFVRDSACIGGIVHFTAAGFTQPDSIGSWSWDFGDGTSPVSSSLNAVHTYSSTGTFITTLTVTDIHGCMNSVSHQVNVHALPNAQFSWNTPNCSGIAVHFTDGSTMNGGYVAKWEWDFGDGSPVQTITLPGSPDITHLYPTTNTVFTVRLKVWSNDSCTNEISHTVNMLAAPVADFQNPLIRCEGQTVHFTDATTTNGGGSIASWNWNFNDPASGTYNTSALQNPDHIFTSAGNYDIKLIVSNVNGCTDTIIKQVTIDMAPVADFTADTACMNSPTSFVSTSTANSSGIIAWYWNFGDGSTSTLENPVHTYAAEGSFTVTLQVTNSGGCSAVVTKQIKVRPLPVPAFTYSAESCIGSPVEFTNVSSVSGTSAMMSRWEWDFGDGTIASVHYPASPVIMHAFAGTASSHTVRLTVVTSDSCQSYIEHVVTSIPSPVAKFDAPAQSCQNIQVAFTDMSLQNGGGNIIGWNWNFGDPASGTNNTSLLQNPIHTYNQPGIYQATLIITNEANCHDTIQKNIEILTRPLADFTADTACLSHPTSFTGISISSINQWHWDFGDGNTSNAPNPSHTYVAAGNYTVTLTVSAGGSCTNSITKVVPVLDRPFAAFSTSAPGCTADSVEFTDQSTTSQGYITSWTWDFGDGNTVTRTLPQSPNVKHKYAYANTYTPVLTVTTSDQCSDQKSMNIVIHPAPIANFTSSAGSCQAAPVQFTNTTVVSVGSPVTQWLWNFGDPASGVNNTSTLQNPSHTFSTGGTFQVTLFAVNTWGCNDSVVKSVTVGGAPVAQFTSDQACQGNPTHFTDASTSAVGTIISWIWNFGDPVSGVNNTSTLQNPSHIYSNTGNYNVTLTVITTGGCTNVRTNPVSDIAKPIALFEATSVCAGNATQFTDLSVAPGSSITAWFWDFGDGSGTSVIQNPSYTYAAAGNYNVKLRVTNTNGCTDSIVLQVFSRPGPAAAFQFISNYCPSGNTEFTDISTGNGAPITERLWIFEPGYTSTSPNPVYVFPVTDTTYMVSLLIADANGCRDTVENPVYIKPGFNFNFAYDTTCFKNSTQFYALNLTPGDTLLNIRWDFGDPASGNNNISYEYNPKHTFTHSGVFAVKMKVMNSDGCNDSIYKNVVVRKLPMPDFLFSDNAGNVIFDDESAPGDGSIHQWEWNFGDGSAPYVINAPGPGNITHHYSPGDYNVSLKVTNTFGCFEMTTKVVRIVTGISAIFNSSDSLNCTRKSIVFADNSEPAGSIINWEWDFGDGKDTLYTAYSPSIIHTYSVSGTYVVRLIITADLNGNQVNDTTTSIVRIYTTPTPAFTVLAGCENGTSFFNDISGMTGIVLAQRKWEFGDPLSGTANTSTLEDPAHKFANAGTYNVKLTLTNEFGCRDSLVKPVRIHAVPKADFINTLACSGSATQFTDNTHQGDTTLQMWHWNFGVAGTKKDTSLLRNPLYRYKDPGNYSVRMVVRDNYGCLDTIDSIVPVFPSPVSAFLVGETIAGMPGKIQLDNQSTGAVSFEWDFGNGYTSTEENPVVTYSKDGSYLIRLVSYSKDDCSDTTFYKYDVLFRGLFIPNAFAPTTNNPELFFRPVGINLGKFRIQVFDEWGHLVWESNKLDSQGRPAERWDGRDSNGALLPQGTYMWKAEATFIDGTIWTGSDIGKGEYKTVGTVALIR